MTPRSPKIAQLLAKTPQDSPKSLQQELPRPATVRNCGQNSIVVLIFTLPRFLQRSAPRPPKMPKITAQSASRWPDEPHPGPSWRHLGPLLPPSSAILPPFWASRACPKSAKICQDSLLAIFLPKVAPRSSQTPSRHRFFSFQGRFLKLSGDIF